jgi:hypothetical protein
MFSTWPGQAWTVTAGHGLGCSGHGSVGLDWPWGGVGLAGLAMRWAELAMIWARLAMGLAGLSMARTGLAIRRAVH